MPNNGLFDTKRDNQLIITGSHFWCETCFVARPLDDQSSDPRYCQGCYDFLLKEAEVLRESGSTRHPGWIPKKPQRAQENQCPIPSPGASIMAGINDKPNHTCQKQTEDGRGRPVLDLPFALIKELQDQDHGATEIRRQLKDKGIEVSMRTLYRVLSGQTMMGVNDEATE